MGGDPRSGDPGPAGSGALSARRAGVRPHRSQPVSLLEPEDLARFARGTHRGLADRLGAHPMTVDGVEGAYFSVWAPRAERVSVMGECNGWDRGAHSLRPAASGGIWEGFVPGVRPGQMYKFHVVANGGAYRADKADPYALYAERPPQSASIVWDLAYEWGDEAWMRERPTRDAPFDPISIYEVHAGSWERVAEEGNRPLSYRELAHRLADHVERMGFTHVELLPVMEHPFYGSWGYQTTGFFAPTSRYGTPQDLMYLIDHLHRRGIGVILDWVPSHFPNDEFSLARFDGGALYEVDDPRMAVHPDWNSYLFDYARGEVRSFLMSSAFHWLSVYHADGLRLDAVASMLYLDYGRAPGEWTPNPLGGRENLGAVRFLRDLGEAIAIHLPGVQTFAEESADWPLSSAGGPGFGMTWDMGWLHETLGRLRRDAPPAPSTRAAGGRVVLPLSHDEVVHGRGSLLSRMAGEEPERVARLRLLLGWLYAQPGKKLLFMGGEFGQTSGWEHEGVLDWDLLRDLRHAGIVRWVADLNGLYRSARALHAGDADPDGLVWLDPGEDGVVSLLRRAGEDVVLVVFGLTPSTVPGYRAGVPVAGRWREVLNGDAGGYGGAGVGNPAPLEAVPVPAHGHAESLSITVPPLGAVFLRPDP